LCDLLGLQVLPSAKGSRLAYEEGIEVESLEINHIHFVFRKPVEICDDRPLLSHYFLYNKYHVNSVRDTPASSNAVYSPSIRIEVVRLESQE
jgi:hypothetical protein